MEMPGLEWLDELFLAGEGKTGDVVAHHPLIKELWPLGN